MSVWKKHIAPRDCGYDEIVELCKFVGPNPGAILDYGCGYGRLTTAFEKRDYIGYDPEVILVQEARENNPKYMYTDMFPSALDVDLLLAYTVFVHMEDSQVTETLEILEPKKICIIEILGKQWRRDGGFPPVYNRSLVDYSKLLTDYKMTLHNEIEHKGYTIKKRKKVLMSYMIWERNNV